MFVANRVQKIRNLSKPEQWYYLPTDQNPADLASRGSTVTQLIESNWFSGPDYLWDVNWTPPQPMEWNLKTGDPEVCKASALETKTETIVNVVDRLKVFSRWNQAVCAIARLKRLAQRKKGNLKPASSDERSAAAKFIIRSLQDDVFWTEMQALKSGLTLKSTSSIYSLSPYIDGDGILRVGGRIAKAPLCDDVKHPAILPKKHHITKLLIRHFHEKVEHQGRGMTQNEIRANGFWIVKGSKTVQSCISKCITCRRMRRPTEEQMMSDLPQDRLEPAPPFTFCGMDCFGPFIVKRGRKEYKRYGLIITCLCSRGIHIEMLDDMTTDCFINALRCFICLRGPVKEFRCDQGSNFVGARNEMKKAMNELDIDRLATFLAEKTVRVPHECSGGKPCRWSVGTSNQNS